jgi:hypothetical protein
VSHHGAPPGPAHERKSTGEGGVDSTPALGKNKGRCSDLPARNRVGSGGIGQ